MEPVYFKKPADLRKWFEKNHQKETELVVGFYKTSSGKQEATRQSRLNKLIAESEAQRRLT